VNVLLVEDSPGDARLFAELLSELPGQPLRLTTVGTLLAALPIASQHDVVFLDLSLPDAHGLVTVTRMVASGRNVPIVVLTGNEDERLAVDAVKAGAQDYLTKSEITPSLIARTARYAVERKIAEENARKLAKSNEAAQRTSFITSLTNAITSSFDLDVTLLEVVKLCVPTLGDYAVIDLVRDGGAIERVALAAHDPELDTLLQQGRKFGPGESHPFNWVTTAIATREPVLVVEMSPADSLGDAEYRALADALQPRAMLAMPLIARGRVVGTLSLTMSKFSGRAFDLDLQQLVAEVAERIALGIDNAILYAAARRAIRGRDELLAVVSHDLRNPLNLIGLALQMIEQDASALEASLPSAKRGVDRMQRLIEDLLDVARIDAGTLNVEPRPMSLASLLEDAYEQHRALATDKRITLIRDFDKRLGGVLADRHRMAQAISNLVGNALKFTPPGGSIRIGGESKGERAALWVADTGPGIPPEHVTHIFDRFWQPTRGRDGVGLGLAIVKGIIDAHEGTIEVDSVPGAGTTFRIWLREAEARPTTEMKPLLVTV
jgi:signal transduction histidine kinase/FixJ family two-component response regulator